MLLSRFFELEEQHIQASPNGTLLLIPLAKQRVFEAFVVELI